MLKITCLNWVNHPMTALTSRVRRLHDDLHHAKHPMGHLVDQAMQHFHLTRTLATTKKPQRWVKKHMHMYIKHTSSASFFLCSSAATVPVYVVDKLYG